MPECADTHADKTGWMDDGLMGEWMDGWMDGSIDGRIFKGKKMAQSFLDAFGLFSQELGDWSTILSQVKPRSFF